MFFTSSGGDVASAHDSLSAVLHDAAALTRSLKTVKPSIINHVPGVGKPAPLLHAAAKEDSVESVRVLLASKADVDLIDATGSTPMFAAVQTDAVSTLRLLIHAGADLRADRPSGAALVYFAAQHNAHRCLELLIQSGADVNKTKEGGFSPLSIACLQRQSECVALLCDARANVDHKYSVADRYTPLMLSAVAGEITLVETLLSAGASLDLRDAGGLSARDIASANGHAAIASFLEEQAQREVQDLVAAAERATAAEVASFSVPSLEQAMSTVSVDDLLSQITQYGSNVEFDASVSRLHAAAQVIATSLLPAQRLEPTMNRLSQDGAQLESELAASSASVGDAEARLLRSSYDNETMQERNALQVRYRQDLDALRRNCEERMGAVSEYASQLNMAESVISGTDPPVLAVQLDASQLSYSLDRAMPLLRRATQEVSAARQRTIDAMRALSSALENEHSLLLDLQAPVAEACVASESTISAAVVRMRDQQKDWNLEALQERLQTLTAQSHAAMRTGGEVTASHLSETQRRLDDLAAAIGRASDAKDDAELARLLNEHEALSERIERAPELEVAPPRDHRPSHDAPQSWSGTDGLVNVATPLPVDDFDDELPVVTAEPIRHGN